MKYKDYFLIAWIDITTYCNAACPQCHRTNPDNLNKVDWLPLVQWSLKDFMISFTTEDMIKIDKFELCGTWGDPIMNKDVKEIIEYIIENSSFTVNSVNNIMRRRNVIQMTRMFTPEEKKLVKQRLIQLAVYYKTRR